LVVPSDKLDKRKIIVKKLLDIAEVKEFNKLSEDSMVGFAKDLFAKNNYQISFRALNMLIDRVGCNLLLLNNECEKLMLYKMNDKKIDEETIEEMIVRYDFDNIFALTDAVIKKDINASLSLYQELLKRNEEPIKIIVLLANQFRLIFQVKRLHTKGFSESQIASNLGVHPYRVKLANEVKLTDKELLSYINSLADLDESIKMGKINKDVGLELFLLRL
jgi:DNA polymerase-3 subunit delta